MKYTRKQMNQIVDRLEYYHSENKRYQEAFGDLCSVLAPTSFSPVLEIDLVQSYLDGLAMNKDLRYITDDLKYFIYDAKNMNNPYIVESDGYRVNVKNKREFVDYLLRDVNNNSTNSENSRKDS